MIPRLPIDRVFPVTLAALLLAALPAIPRALAAAPQPQETLGQFKAAIAPLLAKYCGDCHGAQKPKGELDLIGLDSDMKASTSAARWAMVHERVSLAQMPPKNAKLRPSADESAAILAWIKAEMKRSGKHLAKREAYANGNLVPHELLFDPKQSAPFEAAARVRRLSPENLYVTLLHLAGADRDSFGMADPNLKDLDQHGPLAELLA